MASVRIPRWQEEHDDAVLDKLAAMDASDDMAKMRILLAEEVAARRGRLPEPIVKSYLSPEEGAGSKDTMIIAFAGENDTLVRSRAAAAPPRRPRDVSSAFLIIAPVYARTPCIARRAVCPRSRGCRRSRS